jgi:hypothetical protein
MVSGGSRRDVLVVDVVVVGGVVCADAAVAAAHARMTQV